MGLRDENNSEEEKKSDTYLHLGRIKMAKQFHRKLKIYIHEATRD